MSERGMCFGAVPATNENEVAPQPSPVVSNVNWIIDGLDWTVIESVGDVTLTYRMSDAQRYEKHRPAYFCVSSV
jgi:hypothetical protein